MRKINRIIRFQGEIIETSNPEKTEEDIIANDDVFEEDIQEDGAGFPEWENWRREFCMTKEDYTSKEDYIKDFGQAYCTEKLIERIEMTISGRNYSNMIGVFGIHSDDIVNEACNRFINDNNISYLGKIEYSCSSDIYNEIAAVLLNFVSEHLRRQYDVDYYVREILVEIEKLYENHHVYDDFLGSPLAALSHMTQKSERDRNILSVINHINKVRNYSSYSSSQRNKFLMVVELESIDYAVLKKLSKLNSSELIIIAYSIYGIVTINTQIQAETQGALNGIDKFFPMENCIFASRT